MREDIFVSIMLSLLEKCIQKGSVYVETLSDRAAERLELVDEEDGENTVELFDELRDSMILLFEGLRKMRGKMMMVHRTREIIKFIKSRDWLQICPSKFNPRRSLGLIPYYNGCVFAACDPPTLVYGHPSDLLL